MILIFISYSSAILSLLFVHRFKKDFFKKIVVENIIFEIQISSGKTHSIIKITLIVTEVSEATIEK